jgi:hypothetical protein
LYKDLPAAISDGTLYVTTDEQKLFVDLEGKRIGLNQDVAFFGTVAEVEALTTPSTKMLYYATEDNALLKYDSVKGWVKVNDTEALETAILNNSAAIGVLEEVIGFKRDDSDMKVGDIKAGESGYLICVAAEDGTLKWEPVSGNISARIEALKAELATIKGDSDQDISSIAEEVERLAGLIEDETTGLAPTKVIADKAAEDISKIKNGTNINDFAGVEAAFGSLNETYATDQELSQAVAAARGETEETVASVDAKAVANAEAIEELDKKLTAELQAADALVYRKAISQASELPATEVKAGYTYKISADILKTDFDGVNIKWATTGEQPRDEYYVRAGDILIATGAEDATTGFITNIEWDHVPAGYNADYVPVMSVASEAENAVDIKLTSAHAADGETGDLGSIQFAGAEDSAVSVALTDNKVTIGLTWGTF